MGDPYFDLGDFAVEHPLSRDQEKLIIETYCGKPDQRRFSRMMLHKLTADLWWSVWAMIQNEVSKIDFDFYIYGIRRQERFRRNFYEDDFEKRLGDVR
jgi:thiamine kinase-like enzyme